jgi:hypothetical protein
MLAAACSELSGMLVLPRKRHRQEALLDEGRQAGDIEGFAKRARAGSPAGKPTQALGA